MRSASAAKGHMSADDVPIRAAADGINTAYRAPGRDANSAKPAGPWATKPNHMASGQDFFVQLRKAMATLQQGGSNASSGANST
ncbi:MAG: hypothetical protein M1832_004513 [Thelocarpon impressellum]|nr:MAG: hypothetical protein M1832_004513 [Thelocarpon impressellum]